MGAVLQAEAAATAARRCSSHPLNVLRAGSGLHTKRLVVRRAIKIVDLRAERGGGSCAAASPTRRLRAADRRMRTCPQGSTGLSRGMAAAGRQTGFLAAGLFAFQRFD